MKLHSIYSVDAYHSFFNLKNILEQQRWTIDTHWTSLTVRSTFCPKSSAEESQATLLMKILCLQVSSGLQIGMLRVPNWKIQWKVDDISSKSLTFLCSVSSWWVLVACSLVLVLCVVCSVFCLFLYNVADSFITVVSFLHIIRYRG